MDSRYFVSLQADDGTVISVLLDAASPKLTDGFGGWETVDRPRRVALTRFKGINPVRQDLAILFEGVNEGKSQEVAITNLERMAQQTGDLSEPAKITLGGTALRKDLTWVIESIDMDDQRTMWTKQGGFPVRIRQAAVVHLLEFVDDSVIVTAPSPAVMAKPSPGGKTLTTPQGMTLKQIAALEYNDPDKYTLIIDANPWISTDPRVLIMPGTPLFIPAVNGGWPSSFIVP